jgi:16S rRNA processing protein RimM
VSADAGFASTSSTPTDAERDQRAEPALSPSAGQVEPERIVVGHVARAHGVRGEVTVQIRTDVPDRRFAVGNVLHTDHPDAPVLTVAAARPHSGRLLVTFDEVATREAAEALRGSLLTIDAADVGPARDESDDPDGEAWWDSDLIGLLARTSDGTVLGSVADVLHTPGGDMLAVAREGGQELLVPFVHDIVPTVDPAAGFVIVDPPPGLLEL